MMFRSAARIFVFAVWFTTNASFYLREYADTSSLLAISHLPIPIDTSSLSFLPEAPGGMMIWTTRPPKMPHCLHWVRKRHIFHNDTSVDPYLGSTRGARHPSQFWVLACDHLQPVTIHVGWHQLGHPLHLGCRVIYESMLQQCILKMRILLVTRLNTLKNASGDMLLKMDTISPMQLGGVRLPWVVSWLCWFRTEALHFLRPIHHASPMAALGGRKWIEMEPGNHRLDCSIFLIAKAVLNIVTGPEGWQLHS